MVDWEEFYNTFRRPDFVPGYEIQNRLGGGAFGEVYKASKLSIGKHYAIKFLKLDDQADRAAIERELEQVRLFASIDHPNLVTIEDMGMVMDVPFLIMGYAGEETLARRLQRGDLGRDSALRYFVQICRGVLALHDRRLAHFDLKPGNVFLKGDVARVGDYGLAKLLVEGRQSLSFGRGTPHYMAPEMLRNRADHRADVYSLGVILFESLAHRLPFDDGGSDYGVILRETDDPPVFPEGFPASLRGVVETCLRLDPDHRFASVHGLLGELGQTARQGDSVVLPWTMPPDRRLGSDEEIPLAAEVFGAGGDERDPTRGDDLRAAANEFARGAVEVARGVWDGVTGREAPGEGDSLSPEVISVRTLSEPDEGPLPAGPAGGSALAPALPDPGLGTVPVPPREEGGLVATVSAAVVLGTEIMGTLVTGPVVYVLRAVGETFDRFLRGVPGVVGACVRLILFMLLFAGLGAVVALLVMVSIMGGDVFGR